MRAGPLAIAALAASSALTRGQPPAGGCPAITQHVYKIALYGPENTLEGYGAGFFAAEDGLFVTARHVLEQSARATRVVIEIGEQERPVESVIAESRKLDVAIVRVSLGSARVNVPPVNEGARVGDAVIGFRVAPPAPRDWRPLTGIVCTAGRVSAVSPRAMIVRGEAFFVPGSSGSPVFNAAGQVVAVALEMVNAKRTGKPDWTYTGLPARTALAIRKLAAPAPIADFLAAVRHGKALR